MNNATNRIVGNQLKALRLECGLTQLQVADRISSPQSVVSKLESGARSLYLSELFTYAHALDTTPRSLFCETLHALVAYGREVELARL